MMWIDGNSRRGTMKKVCEEKSRIFHPYQVWHWPKYTSAKVLAKNWIFLFYQIWPTKTWDINFKELKPSCYRWTGSYGCNPIPFWLVPRPAATPIQCHFWILILVYTVHNLLHAKFRPIDFMISPLTWSPIFWWELNQTLQLCWGMSLDFHVHFSIVVVIFTWWAPHGTVWNNRILIPLNWVWINTY